MLVKVIKVVLMAFLVLAFVLGLNTWRNNSKQLEVQALPELAVNVDAVAEHLVGAVRTRTIFSFLSPDLGAAEFEKLHRHLESEKSRMASASSKVCFAMGY